MLVKTFNIINTCMFVIILSASYTVQMYSCKISLFKKFIAIHFIRLKHEPLRCLKMNLQDHVPKLLKVTAVFI